LNFDDFSVGPAFPPGGLLWLEAGHGKLMTYRGGIQFMMTSQPPYAHELPDPWTADARLDPWTIAPVKKGEAVLFGYAAAHPLTGGLSWLRSSPVQALDIRLRRAMTMSGRRYDLGHRVEVERVPSLGLEAWLAYDLLVSPQTEDKFVPPVSADRDREHLWLATQKMARHLKVTPPSLDPDDVVRFIENYRDLYLQKRKSTPQGEL
jgi:hypothetical protein